MEVSINSSLFWLFMQLFLAVYRRFGRAYRSLFQGSSSARKRIVWLKTWAYRP